MPKTILNTGTSSGFGPATGRVSYDVPLGSGSGAGSP
jgi:hypothetical protein